MRPRHHVMLQFWGRRKPQHFLATAHSHVTCAGFCTTSRTTGPVTQAGHLKHETIELPVGVSGRISLEYVQEGTELDSR